MKYFLGLSSQYSSMDILRHTFAIGDETFLSELRAFLAAHYGATYDHVAVYANGRTALNVALKAITKRGGKVVVTSMTCYAVVQAIKAAGLVPIFADIDKETLHYGAKELEKAIEDESNVQAIIVQNNLGIPVKIDEIEQVAKKHKLEIIEDLAHCAGVKYADGRETGTVGRATILSFGKGKSIDAVTGGAVVFPNPLDTPVKQPENPPLFKDNFRARIYPLLCAIIRCGYNLSPLIGKYLTATFVRLQAIKRSADGVIDPNTRLTYWQCRLALRQLQALSHRGSLPIRDFYLVRNRDEVLKKLEENGYFMRDIWYTLPVAPDRYFKKADFHPEECPVAVKVAEQIINLPTYYGAAEMKPALKIIKDYLVDENAEEEINVEGVMTETEKRAKIKAEKAERIKKKKAEKKAKKAEKKQLKKKLKEDGAPDEEMPEEQKKNVKKIAKEKIVSLVAKVPKELEKAKNKEKKSQQITDDQNSDEKYGKNEKTTVVSKDDFTTNTGKTSDTAIDELEGISILEETSDILSASEVEDIAKNEKTHKEPRIKADEKPEKIEEPKKIEKSKKIEKTKTGEITPTSKSKTPSTPSASSTSSTPNAPSTPSTPNAPSAPSAPSVNSVGGMRQAPRKLTDREKLKLELESGKKGGPSVI